MKQAISGYDRSRVSEIEEEEVLKYVVESYLYSTDSVMQKHAVFFLCKLSEFEGDEGSEMMMRY